MTACPLWRGRAFSTRTTRTETTDQRSWSKITKLREGLRRSSSFRDRRVWTRAELSWLRFNQTCPRKRSRKEGCSSRMPTICLSTILRIKVRRSCSTAVMDHLCQRELSRSTFSERPSTITLTTPSQKASSTTWPTTNRKSPWMATETDSKLRSPPKTRCPSTT